MIESTILSHLLLNEDYGRKVIPFLKDEYFHDPAEKTLFALIKNHTNKYGCFPSKEALFIDLSNIKGINEKLFIKSKEKLENLVHDDGTNVEWLLDQTEQFCQDKALYNGIMQAIKIVDGNQDALSKGSIPHILQEALSVSFDTNIGHDYLEDWEKRYELYHKKENKIPFDLEYFNKITRGGFSKKTLNILLGGTHVGKSLFMCHLAASNLMIGRNVLYITLEMSEEETAKRIDANLLDIPISEMELIPKPTMGKLVTTVREKTPGKLIIKEFPTASASTTHFRFIMNELRLKKNFVPDIIYVDYINICLSSRIKPGTTNSYGYVKAISEELRGLAGEFNVPVVSATQLNRTGFADTDADMTHTSESFGLPMTADFMVALISSEELQNLSQYMVKQLKNRYSDMAINKRFVVGVDKMKMRLYDVEESAQNLMQDFSNTITDMSSAQTATIFDMSKFADFK